MDLTLCHGGDCPLRESCRRFLAPRHGRFDAFGALPYRDGRCDHFLDVTEEVRRAAYFLWLAEGRPSGRDEGHWRAAKARLYPGR